MKPKIAVVRGKFLNKYEMQSFEPLTKNYSLTAFGSRSSFHAQFAFPVTKLASPMDLPELPYKMQLLNRLLVDAHYLFGLEKKLQGFDIAHSAETYYHYTQQCLNAKEQGYIKKVVVTVLENIPFNNEGIWGRKAFKKRTRTEADVLVALTQKTKNMLIQEGTDPQKITIIGSGIDTKRFTPGKRMKYPFMKQAKTIRLLFVGRLEIYKGIIDVIESVACLLRDPELQSNNLQLLLVGKGSQEHQIKHLITKYAITKRVKMKSIAYDQIHKVYQEADIMVVPSCDTKTWQEQYGYMLLEGQASGLPIVTTYSGSIPEVVGNGAFLVQQHAVNELSLAIKQLIVDPQKRRSLSQLARKRAVGFHDISHKAKQLRELYSSLL
jgi:glycosyltransferase involved in cell wall biosynthesis